MHAKIYVLFFLFFLPLSAYKIEIWQPQNTSRPSVELALYVEAEEPWDDYALCLHMLEGDGHMAKMGCQSLESARKTSTMLNDLLPGRRTMNVQLIREERVLAEATTNWLVISTENDSVDITAALSTHSKPSEQAWYNAVPSAQTTSEARALYFDAIYQTKYWSARGRLGREIPASGPGSSRAATLNAVAALTDALELSGANRLVDAPCGDLFWIQSLLLTQLKTNYLGLDVAPALIKSLQGRFQHIENISFDHLDLADPIAAPSTLQHIFSSSFNDLLFSRHLLFHLPPEDGRRVLNHFVSSGAAWLLTSTYLRSDNAESFVLANGHTTNLFKSPYCVIQDPIRMYADAHPDQFLALWDLRNLSRHTPTSFLGTPGSC